MGHTDEVRQVTFSKVRFIPTCVGHTISCLSSSVLAIGSSPRAWGILPLFRVFRLFLRFIPTCVGHTQTTPRSIRFQPVHPHVRGAYTKYFLSFGFSTRFIPTCVGHTKTAAAMLCAIDGSSPRAWGIRFLLLLSVAGTSGSSPRAWGIRVAIITFSPVFSVHPHVRGAYDVLPEKNPEPNGSSPRAWGIRTIYAVQSEVLRFIPTCVGHTSIG